MAQIVPTYPIVTYPRPVMDAFCFDEPFPKDLQAPLLERYPEKPQDPAPLNVKEPREVKGGVSFANWVGVVFLFAAFFAFSFTKEKENPVAITFGLLFVGLALRIWYGSFKTSERYDAEFRDYSRVKAEHGLLTKRYQEALARYLDPETYVAIDRVNFDRLKNYAQTDSYRQYCAGVERHERFQLSAAGLVLLITRNTRCRMIRAYTSQHAVAPSTHGLPVTRGVFDEYFYHLLEKEFPEKVFLDYSAIDPVLGISRYFPDAVYADFENHLFIDIEIDEPYTKKEGEGVPIHCCYTGLDGRLAHEDNFRNAYFNEQGWTVVRFSEAQVADDPEACLAFLRKIVCSFATGLMVNEQAFPLRQDCWTETEARDLFQADSRSHYFSPRIMSHSDKGNSSLVRPIRAADGSVCKDRQGRLLGSVRIVQYLKGSLLPFVQKRRVASAGATIEELEKIVAQGQLKHGSILPGKIVLKETLNPQWKGQLPKNRSDGLPAGFTINNTFYPVYASYKYTEDLKAEDVIITEKEARAWASVVYPDPADDLPF